MMSFADHTRRPVSRNTRVFEIPDFDGGEPNREDVADLIAWEKGEIDDEEYDGRAD